MMFRNFFLLIALFFTSVLSAQELKRVQFPVTSVTIFTKGAQVSMDGKIALPAGKSQILVEGITTSLADGTLQAVASGKTVILSITQEKSEMHAIDLQEQLKLFASMKDSLEINKMQLEVVRNEKEVLLLNRQIGGKDGVKTAELKQLADFMMIRLTEISRRIYHYQKEVAHDEQQLQEIRKRLEEILSRQLQTSTAVKMLIESPVAQTVDLTLNYIVGNAGWSPLYDIRLPEEGGEAKLVSRGRVWQNTGIDWNNVGLVLSSGNPRAIRQVPVIYPYFLQHEPRPVFVQNVMNTASQRELSAKEVAGLNGVMIQERIEEPVMDAGIDPIADQAQNMNNVDYIIKVPYSVPSGPDGSEVQIAGLSVPVTYEYIVMPRVSQEALLVAGIADFSGYNLLDGEVSLYLGNSYRGTQMINRNVLSPMTDVLSLSMGVDKGIVVKRVPKQNFRKITGGTIRVQKLWETIIRNNKNIPVKIKVEDQYPLSQDDKIKVEDIAYTQQNAEVDITTGKITWNITLQPKESISVNVGYTVKFPKDWEVYVR